MSYYCTISFKQIESKDIYPFLLEFKSTAIEKMEEIASSEYHFCPFCRNELFLPEKYMEIPREKRDAAVSWAINSVFMYRYFYNEELNLLGVYGVSDALKGLFDVTVQFQNSCDQNYDRKGWEGVKFFEDTYDRLMLYSNEEIVKKYEEKNGIGSWKNDLDDCDEIEMLDYCRKSMCYEEIWRHFESTLYEHEKTLYFGVLGPNDFSETRKFVVECFQRFKDWEKECEELEKRLEK